jgi:hypothetical protein
MVYPATFPSLQTRVSDVAALGPELDEAIDYARSARSPATRRAYRSDFEIFRSWCEAKRLSALPASAEAVAAFLAFDVRNGTKPTTLTRRLAAIRYAHTSSGHPSPTASEAVKATTRGIKRTFRHSSARKAPATSDKLAAMVVLTGDGLRAFAIVLCSCLALLAHSDARSSSRSTSRISNSASTACW